MKQLGRSQKAIIDLLQCDGPSTTQFFGDQLYATTSSCARYGDGTGNMGGTATPAQVRRAWASKLLNELRKKGLVDFVKEGKDRIWSLTEKGKKHV